MEIPVVSPHRNPESSSQHPVIIIIDPSLFSRTSLPNHIFVLLSREAVKSYKTKINSLWRQKTFGSEILLKLLGNQFLYEDLDVSKATGSNINPSGTEQMMLSTREGGSKQFSLCKVSPFGSPGMTPVGNQGMSNILKETSSSVQGSI